MPAKCMLFQAFLPSWCNQYCIIKWLPRELRLDSPVMCRGMGWGRVCVGRDGKTLIIKCQANQQHHSYGKVAGNVYIELNRWMLPHTLIIS